MDNDPQVQAFKEGWKKYGKTAVITIVVVIALVYGARFWKQHGYSHATQASILYDRYQQALDTRDEETLTATYNSIQTDYADTPYASAVTLIEAARAAGKGDLVLAKERLQWVLEHGEAFTKPIARLRLAEIQMQEQDFDGALALLSDVDDTSPYKPAYDELKGDILMQQGKVDEALALYRNALTAFREQGFDNLLLQYKLQTYAPIQPLVTQVQPNEQPNEE